MTASTTTLLKRNLAITIMLDTSTVLIATARPASARLAIALAILGSFTLVEAVGGYFANSIALLAEAAHMLADSASLVLAILAIRVGRRPANAQRTYGHRRYQPLAALLNGLALLLLTA